MARAHMAEAIGVPEHRIRFNPVASAEILGKGSLMDTLLCYYLARAADRLVKMVMNSFEELTAGEPAPFRQHHCAPESTPTRSFSRSRRE
jgi:hypothetical protein